jgi:hypothetical protein
MLNQTISEVNFKTSLRKFFYTELEENQGVPITFDRNLSVPYVSGQVGVDSINTWVAILYGPSWLSLISDQIIDFYCCSRKDADDVILSSTIDKLLELIYPENERLVIPFYDATTEDIISYIFPSSHPPRTDGPMKALDGTNFSVVTIRFKWATTI